jgi:hypothetical protein
MRKLYIDVTVRLIVEVEEGKTVDNTMESLDMTFVSTDETVEVVDATIENFNLTDSK